MKTRISTLLTRGVPLAVLLFTGASAQVPVDDEGNPIGTYETADAKALQDAEALGNEGIPLLSAAELDELVGPVALYPDDLLAVVLPASTYPLQVVQAARFLEDLENDPSLEPNPEWDDSIIALVNYPEVVELLNDDLDWTWRLGEAVVAQQADVVNAVENFRDRAYAAGNLKSDGYQTVERNEGVIEITPVNEDIIYVPYYEPERVVYYQPRPVYYYYPRPYPVYYYPYSSGYAFSRPYFWGVTTAFTIGWTSNHLRVFHHSYHGHPYYGRHYYDRWWYRRPDIHVYNNVYIRNNVTVNRYVDGDYWRPSRDTRLRSRDQRITRNTYYRDQGGSSGSTTINRYVNNNRDARDERRNATTRSGTNRQANTNRLTSQEQMRRTINEVQRERGTESRDGVNGNQRRSTTRRDAAERQSQDRQTTTRQDSGSRVTQQQIARQFADRREARDRQPAERRSTQRQTTERETVQRQSSERQPVQRYTTQRQDVPQQRETAERRATTQRQTTQRRTTERQVVPQQRQTTERRATAQRQTTERRATTQRQTAERQPAQRQTVQRQAPERQPSQSSGNARGESSARSQSSRERRERR